MARKFTGVSEDKARGTWTARYRFAPGPKGTRTRRGFASQAEAKKWRDIEVGKVSRGNAVDPRDSAMTVGAAFESWISDYRRDPLTASSTIESKSSMWRASLAPAFATMPLSYVNKVNVRRWQMDRLNAGKAPSTVNNEHATLSLILDHAIDLGALDRNYAKEVRRVSKGGLTRKALPDADTIARLMAAIEPRYLIVLNLALYAGLRSGEARGLRITDVVRNGDGTCTLSVTEQLDRQGNRAAPKGRRARTVIESEFVADLIAAHVAFYGTGPLGEVVTHEKGNALNYNTWRDIWVRTVRAAGVTLPKGRGVHLLRHAYASYAIADRKDPAQVAANLGHAQVSTTFAYYVHATERRPVGAAAARSAIDAAAERIEVAAAIARTPRAENEGGEAF